MLQHDPDMSLFTFSYCINQGCILTFYPWEMPQNPCIYLMADMPHTFNTKYFYIPDLRINVVQQYPPPLVSLQLCHALVH